MCARLKPPIPKHRVAAVTFDSEPEARRRLLNSDWCGLCEKAGFRTKTDARSYIGLLLSKKGRLPGPKDFLIVPYRCPHKRGWHIGHDPIAKKLLEGKKR